MKINEVTRTFPVRNIEVYHGDNHGTVSLEPHLMNNGNNQEGIGIYFSNRYATAQFYGSHIIKATIDLSRFVPAREPVSVLEETTGIINILQDMYRVDPESMFYLMTDYGIFIQEPEDIVPDHIHQLCEFMKNEQVRNFQITMAETFNVIDFVHSWNRHLGIHGTYESNGHNDLWVAIINPNIEVERITT